MKYSVYFEKVREIADTNPQLAESLLHEAESYASQIVPEHLVLCARGRKRDFHNHDNKIIGRLYIKNVFSQIRVLNQISDTFQTQTLFPWNQTQLPSEHATV